MYLLASLMGMLMIGATAVLALDEPVDAEDEDTDTDTDTDTEEDHDADSSSGGWLDRVLGGEPEDDGTEAPSETTTPKRMRSAVRRQKLPPRPT